jgi:hypothetical protein
MKVLGPEGNKLIVETSNLMKSVVFNYLETEPSKKILFHTKKNKLIILTSWDRSTSNSERFW